MKLSSADNAMSINKVKLTCVEIFDNIQTISYIKENIITGALNYRIPHIFIAAKIGDNIIVCIIIMLRAQPYVFFLN